jgi:hypothetical protein
MSEIPARWAWVISVLGQAILITSSCLLANAFAGEPAEGVAEQVAEVEKSVDDLAALVVYARDRHLVEKGLAPHGWVQPDVDQYIFAVDGRPSMLPYDHFMTLVAAQKVRADFGDQYTTWVAQKKLEDAAEDAD